MDPLSITASAIAVGSLVQTTLVSLNSLVRDYKAFSQELATLGSELQSLSLVISSLEKYVAGKSTLTAPLDDKHLVSALNACRPTVKAIKAKCKELRRSASQGSINKLMVGLFWSSTRTELQELRSNLESHKTTLLLSLQLKSL
jgi:Fungal N-terminal domain of STAND proteins